MLTFLPASRPVRHLLFWLAVAGYFLVPQLIYPDYQHTVGRYFFGFAYQQSPYFLPILFAYALGVAMLYTYAGCWWVLPPLLGRHLGRGLLRLAGLTVAVCYLFRLLSATHLAWLDPWLRHLPARPLDPRFFHGWFFYQVYFNEYTTIVLLVAGYKFFENWQRRQQQAQQLAQAQLRTELHAMKAQVKPRFLRGSLATLGQLLDQRALHAPALVLSLSQFLSYVLYQSQAELVSLPLEVGALQQYLTLERARLGDQLDVSFTVTTGDALHQIAPLLLLPLLENAFQHSATPGEQAWLSGQLTLSGEELKFSLANSRAADERQPVVEGQGLQALRRRLAARYPGRHELKLEAQPGLFLAVLTLQLAAPSPGNSPTISHPDEIALPAGG